MRRRVRTRDEYRARGIHPAWNADFIVFRDYVLEHLGPHPKGGTIDRIKNELGYIPGNIRWASPMVQARNRGESNTRITVNGVTRCIAEWAEVNDLTSNVICARIRNGWAPELAVTEPRRYRRT